MGDALKPIGDGIASETLHKDTRETVRFITLDAGAELSEQPGGGAELLVIEGTAQAGLEPLETGSWMRLPQGVPLTLTAGESGAKVWIKTGHLPFAQAPAV